jgi:hypothetical protein
MWGETHALVRNHGGSVVSTANAWPLRFEVPPTGSALLQMLGSFGHRPRFVGASKRLEPLPSPITKSTKLKLIFLKSIDGGRLSLIAPCEHRGLPE